MSTQLKQRARDKFCRISFLKSAFVFLSLSLLSSNLSALSAGSESLPASTALRKIAQNSSPSRFPISTELIAAGGSATATKESSVTPKETAKLEELSLNDLQDVGILLSFIQEQCINVYEEAARVPVSVNSGPEMKVITKIPITLNPQQTFLPARQEWLVFYVGTIEPVIRQFGKMVKDMETGAAQVVVPDALEKPLDKLFVDWSKDTEQLNHHLDELVPLFDEAPKHAEKIRELAVACYGDAERMEQVRRQIFQVIRKNAKHGGDKILITPQ